jgi:glycerol kinase
MQKSILALDQGTTSSRAIVFGHDGLPVARSQHEFPQHFPQPGWVEHDALDIWRTQLACARDALHQAGLDASQVAAIGIANQREATVLWGRASGEPVARPRVTDTTALGAAYLAGLAVGVWDSVDDTARQWRAERCFEPMMDAGRRQELMHRWARAVVHARDWAQD